jgi:hypothetical protein
VLGAGYIPKLHWTDAIANSEGLFGYFRYAEASFILTCRTPDQTGSGWAGTTGVKDVRNIDAADAHRGGGRQGAAVAQAAGDRARQLHRHSRAAAAARYLSLMLGALNARAAEEGRSFMSGKERGDDGSASRCSATTSPPQPDRQPDPAADAGRAGRPRRPRA